MGFSSIEQAKTCNRAFVFIVQLYRLFNHVHHIQLYTNIKKHYFSSFAFAALYPRQETRHFLTSNYISVG